MHQEEDQCQEEEDTCPQKMSAKAAPVENLTVAES